MALALVAAAWAKRHGRPLAVLTVDHGLRPESRAWTEQCGRLARRLDASFHPLAWEGAKPLRGLPAAARAARHGLIAEAARQAGAQVVLLGHTADDLAEAARMRAAGSTTPDPREWAPSPAWPEGRGVFLLRPLLAAGRDEIRAWLRGRGESWIEDPANQDLRFARARARAAPEGEARPAPETPPGLADLARATQGDAAGTLVIAREHLRRPAARAFIATASLCAAGTSRPPRRERAEALAARMAGEGTFVATLGGARIEADAAQVRFLRDPGEALRGGLPEQALAAGVAVWDGRFEITTERPIAVRAIGGLRRRLPRAERNALAAFPPRGREALPTVVEGEITHCPVLGTTPGVTVRALAYERLLAACGAIERES